MLNVSDRRNVEKTSQTANLLVQDLQGFVKFDLLLADIALEVLQQAAQIEQRLNRLETITRDGENGA
jgi:hypothetical protein